MIRIKTHVPLVFRVAAFATLTSLCGLAQPAKAQVDISGTASGGGTLTPLSATQSQQSFSLSGIDSVFGAFTGVSTALVNLTDPTHLILENGTFTQTFAGGTLFGTVSGTGVVTAPGVATFTNHNVVTGGTGIFAGALGDIFTTATVTRTSPTTFSADASYTGKLVMAPEADALGLLASGLLIPGAALLFRRKRSHKTSVSPR